MSGRAHVTPPTHTHPLPTSPPVVTAGGHGPAAALRPHTGAAHWILEGRHGAQLEWLTRLSSQELAPYVSTDPDTLILLNKVILLPWHTGISSRVLTWTHVSVRSSGIGWLRLCTLGGCEFHTFSAICS